MNRSATASEDSAPPPPSWLSRSAISVISVSFYAVQIVLGTAVFHENYWLAVPLALICSHLMHGLLIGFHEASHSNLRKNRRFNDFEGQVIGALSYISFTLYRVAHQSHHSHLATERDVELWPFVDPKTPRWGRVLAACLELTCGIVFTPYLFLRVFLKKDSPIRSERVRRRIWIEIAAMTVFWILLVSAVAWFDVWRYFLWMYVIPGVIAGNLQSWRKYIEHVGLTGGTIKSGTRSIVADNWIGRFIAFTLLHEPYHGVHHLHMGLPHAELPGRAAELKPESPGEFAPFPSYFHAFVHLFKCLSDPRVGPQWNPGDIDRSGNRQSASSR